MKSWGYALFGAVVGGSIVFLGQGTELHMKPVGLSYNDWAGVLLAGAALVVTAVGVVMAIAAIWGFSGIKSGAEMAAVAHVVDQLADGNLGPKLNDAFMRFLDQRMKDGAFRQFIEDRVDGVLFGGAAVRAEQQHNEDEDIEIFDSTNEDVSPPPNGAAQG